MSAKPIVRRLADTEPTECPCGLAYRIVTAHDGGPVSFHITKIQGQATKHRHAKHTETYYCLEGLAHIELDDETHEFAPGTAVVIPPGVAHAVRGDVTIVNVVYPPFDGEDEEVVE